VVAGKFRIIYSRKERKEREVCCMAKEQGESSERCWDGGKITEGELTDGIGHACGRTWEETG
jgi:hypothetical protein